MLIAKGESAFEISIRATDGEWEGRIVEHNVNRLTPTLHLRHNWRSVEAALAGVQRRWQRLFPDEPAAEQPDFHAAVLEPESTVDEASPDQWYPYTPN
jgi:hypothetical protein